MLESFGSWEENNLWKGVKTLALNVGSFWKWGPGPSPGQSDSWGMKFRCLETLTTWCGCTGRMGVGIYSKCGGRKALSVKWHWAQSLMYLHSLALCLAHPHWALSFWWVNEKEKLHLFKQVTFICKFKKLIWNIKKKTIAEADQWRNTWLNNKRAKCRT